MIKNLVSCIVLSHLSLSVESQTYTYTEYDNGFYIGVKASNTLWQSTANAYCASAHGTQLASIHSATDNANLIDAVAGTGGPVGSSFNWIWIGLTDELTEGTFEWLDGTPLDYTNWLSGEPNSPNSAEDCVLIDNDRGGGWFDYQCLTGHIVQLFACNRGGPAGTDPPTSDPSVNPTHNPTNKPTNEPTDKPTESPTPQPTEPPTNNPTDKPTDNPTDKPTPVPSPEPTVSPTMEPTLVGECTDGVCDCDPMSPDFEDPFCAVCQPGDGGCSQCQGTNGEYFKLGNNYPCANCQDVFGDECLFCQNFNGCGQCQTGYDRVQDVDGDLFEGYWYCKQQTPSPTKAPISKAPTITSTCTDGIAQCPTANCAGSGENPNCSNQQAWGCPSCDSGYFMKSHQYPCVLCETLEGCIGCSSWSGCVQCDAGYSWYWDGDCGIGRCQ